ncbi:peptidase domain-containing ABC transporter [Vibrio coralliilyticus]|uniref:peptidase domain-containing ABC transporter n=1 Tax=Vibrio coralliilyticus TaxID=190893 RepID=UPI002409F5E0|nr:peptidase domain-containing ABC transporter [Vibrio coralliilyticus]WFB51271.1 peptidase domain-containing ABC transporter [Vibrio coralliilyticus]
MTVLNNLAERLQIGFTRKIPLFYQSEAAECGLACVAMVAEYWGHKLNLTRLRSEMSVSLNGSTLNDLMKMAHKLDLSSRPLRVDIEALKTITTPCILHWDLNHFVVLVKVSRNRFYIHDPSVGRRRLTLDEFSQHFTGVVLEITPFDSMSSVTHDIHKPTLKDIFGRPQGLKGSLGKIVVLALVYEICVLGASFLPQIVIDQVVPSQDKNLLYLVIAGFGLLLLIRVGANYLRAWTVMAVSATFNLQWRARVFRHMMHLPIPFFEKRNLGDIASRFDSLDVIENAITKQVVEALLDGMLALGALAMLFVYDEKIAAVALASMSTYLLLRQFLFARFRERNLEFILSSVKEKTYFLETIRSIQSIRLFGRTDNRAVRWQNLLVDERNADIRQQKLGIGFESMSTLIFGVEGLIIVLVGTAAALKGEMTVGMLIAALSFKDQFSSRVSGFIDTLFDLRMLGLHMERVGDVVLSEPEEDGLQRSYTSIEHLMPSISFQNVSFRYSEHEPMVIENLSFTISAGEAVALVGASGCGKTTVVKLILGMLSPTQGQILVDDMPLSSLRLTDYRQLIGSVMQDDTLLSGSLEENISFFDLEVDTERVREVAALADIRTHIERLPMAYETLIGELGNTLSGGQRQRVLLARALYRQPKILVLDEATSHLDPDSEHNINRMISDQSVTRIIVAHRSSTIGSADRIIDIAALNHAYRETMHGEDECVEHQLVERQ